MSLVVEILPVVVLVAIANRRIVVVVVVIMAVGVLAAVRRADNTHCNGHVCLLHIFRPGVVFGMAAILSEATDSYIEPLVIVGYYSKESMV